MKKIIIPCEKDSKVVEYADGLLLGLSEFSTHFIYTYTIDEIKKIIEKYPEKDIFLALNKNIANEELPLLEEYLKEIEKLSIKGLLFYDLAILHMKKRLALDISLYWAQEHFTTNYLTAEYYRKEGTCGTYISADITKEEILEIRKNTKGEMMVPIFGYLPMFSSKRHLVKNYEKTFNLKGKGSIYTFENKDNIYKIVEDVYGTTAYSSHILNGISIYSALESSHVEYAVISGQFLQKNIFQDIVKTISHIDENNIDEIVEKVDELCLHQTNTGFLYKETIYKVK